MAWRSDHGRRPRKAMTVPGNFLCTLFYFRPAELQRPLALMAAAPFGSSLILPISYAYISMMGSAGVYGGEPAGYPQGQLHGQDPQQALPCSVHR